MTDIRAAMRRAVSDAGEPGAAELYLTLAEALLDDVHHDLVGDQRAEIDEFFHLLAELGVLLGGVAEDIVGGDVGDAEGSGELLGLGSLPDRGGADEQESHRVLLSPRDRIARKRARRWG